MCRWLITYVILDERETQNHLKVMTSSQNQPVNLKIEVIILNTGHLILKNKISELFSSGIILMT